MVVQASIISRLEESRERGVEYLMAQQRADGAIGNPEKEGLGPYYKTLWALTCAGRVAEANRLASWITQDLLTDEGDFAGPLRGSLFDRSYAYPNAWLIIGAHKLGRYDISRRGMEFLLLLHHETGGFRVERDNEDAVQDVLNTAQGGNACLTTGHVTEAKGVGRFLRTVYEAQPDPAHELFFVYKPGQGLRTSFPDERQKMHSIRHDTPRQAYFNMGIAAAFLARLALTTGDASWSVLGRDYLQLAFNALDEMYETAQVGKVGWGAALVYQTTGDEKMRQLATRVGEAMAAQQTDTGGWDNTGGYVNDAIRTEVTAEFVVLLDEMIAGLAAR
ncbi:MAG TPA: hypothetical protein VJP07_10515 [Dehalococcoidia bacterium]|nr:hypothetical protein [Dehalococcoidia bacterium]